MCFFITLGIHVHYDERMNPSKVSGKNNDKMDINGNKHLKTIETKRLCASLSNLADMLTMVRGWTLLILEVKKNYALSLWHQQ